MHLFVSFLLFQGSHSRKKSREAMDIFHSGGGGNEFPQKRISSTKKKYFLPIGTSRHYAPLEKVPPGGELKGVQKNVNGVLTFFFVMASLSL